MGGNTFIRVFSRPIFVSHSLLTLVLIFVSEVIIFIKYVCLNQETELTRRVFCLSLFSFSFLLDENADNR